MIWSVDPWGGVSRSLVEAIWDAFEIKHETGVFDRPIGRDDLAAHGTGVLPAPVGLDQRVEPAGFGHGVGRCEHQQVARGRPRPRIPSGGEAGVLGYQHSSRSSDRRPVMLALHDHYFATLRRGAQGIQEWPLIRSGKAGQDDGTRRSLN